MICHLTSCLESRRDSGFEFYTFEVAFSGVQAAVDRQNKIGRGDSLREFLCAMYTRPRRPEIGDIVEATMTSAKRDNLMRITLKIRRGHWDLAEFLKAHVFHGGISTQLVGNILQVVCNCGEIEILDARSIR